MAKKFIPVNRDSAETMEHFTHSHLKNDDGSLITLRRAGPTKFYKDWPMDFSIPVEMETPPAGRRPYMDITQINAYEWGSHE